MVGTVLWPAGLWTVRAPYGASPAANGPPSRQIHREACQDPHLRHLLRREAARVAVVNTREG
jgi:hypothetical protein